MGRRKQVSKLSTTTYFLMLGVGRVQDGEKKGWEVPGYSGLVTEHGISYFKQCFDPE